MPNNMDLKTCLTDVDKHIVDVGKSSELRTKMEHSFLKAEKLKEY